MDSNYLLHCKHGEVNCSRCSLDFRYLNAVERQEYAAKISKRKAKKEQKRIMRGPCAAIGCDKIGCNMCSRCRTVGYCSAECQQKDWKCRHREECKNRIPYFVHSQKKKIVATYPIGTKIDFSSGGEKLFRVKILKFNPLGPANPADPLASNLATYSLQVVDSYRDSLDDSLVWDVPCDSVHCERKCKKVH
uniref:MYND-type domain-containing protein n=1 Tax=Pseudo-nitzschia australis TaxID=44445 RepID=A0A7S4ATA8_9STRA|mmetsp:Transcript_26862/g.58959  ORF Transcript_26862/g.58959 Transcript_26862/m.58959 type:complete len:191 (-) Transcript_26862:514-1086(-)